MAYRQTTAAQQHSSSSDIVRTNSENQKLCTLLGQYFCDKIVLLKQTIASKLASLPPPLHHLADLPFTGSSFLDNLQPVTKSEVLKLLQSTQPKSSQLDFIPTSLLKSCSDVFSDIICTLANLSFTQGCFPSSFKHASVTPLLKKNLTLILHYLPVTDQSPTSTTSQK